MKDNIVSEDEFVKRIMKEHPEYNEVSVRNKYKYLTIPSEFNSQLHPLIEFEQRAGKSGFPTSRVLMRLIDLLIIILMWGLVRIMGLEILDFYLII